MPGGGSGGKTPASMIMAGIIQIRQMQLNTQVEGKYYQSAWLLYEMSALLPLEAYDDGFKINPPVSGGDQQRMTPDIEIACRKYLEENAFNVNKQIPKYVYGFFERGRKIKRGY